MIDIDLKPDKAKLRGFGWIAAVFFSFWTYWFLFHFRIEWLAYGFAALAIYGFLGAIALPSALKWLYLGLTLVAFPIGWVVSNVLLMLIFFLVFAPIGLLLRLTGHDPMQRKRTPLQSRWIPCKTHRSAKSYYQLY